MKTNEELLKENAELRIINIELQRSEVNFKAMNEVLRLAIKSLQYSKENNSGAEPSISVFHRDIDLLIGLGSLTPSQHLTDIQADAQQECLAAIRSDLGNHISKATEIGEIDFLLSLKFTDRMIQEYANKLRGESK
tara:strand:- start:1095 stop:1502 length:408 start_codon:yes stop_codon:yes gene_type:complete